MSWNNKEEMSHVNSLTIVNLKIHLKTSIHYSLLYHTGLLFHLTNTEYEMNLTEAQESIRADMPPYVKKGIFRCQDKGFVRSFWLFVFNVMLVF
jgi:hypothetical protein